MSFGPQIAVVSLKDKARVIWLNALQMPNLFDAQNYFYSIVNKWFSDASFARFENSEYDKLEIFFGIS